MTDLPIRFADVELAASRIAGHLAPTPQAHSETLSNMTGAEVVVKFENFQFTASFKERGALNKLLLMTKSERSRGVIAVSAGNHAQGVARHARLLGVAATIVMPLSTPAIKVERTRILGARVVLAGESFEAARAAAEEIASAENLVPIDPYDDPAVMAGQGTIGIEMFHDDQDIDILVIPVGGGGLIAGIATASRSLSPRTKVIGVQSELYPGMKAVLSGATTVTGGPTVAEGIAVREPGIETRKVAASLVDDIITVDEETIEAAVRAYLDVEKVLAEGAGAAPLAALMAFPGLFSRRKVGLVLSGGNIDLRFLADLLLRDLARSGRLCWLEVDLPDRPGALARLTNTVAQADVNILEIVHHRDGRSRTPRGASVDLHLEFDGPTHQSRLLHFLELEGFAPSLHARAKPSKVAVRDIGSAPAASNLA